MTPDKPGDQDVPSEQAKPHRNFRISPMVEFHIDQIRPDAHAGVEKSVEDWVEARDVFIQKYTEVFADRIAKDIGLFADIDVSRSVSSIDPAPTAPPSTYLLDLLMAGTDGKDAAANLEDIFPYWESRHGPQKARILFRIQVGYILVGYWWNRTLSQVERVLKLVNVFSGLRGG